MRNVALICAAIVIVVGAVVGSVLVITANHTTTEHRAARASTRPAPTPTPSVTSTPDRFALASAGLHRLVVQHRPTTARPVVALTSCPFAPDAPLASTGLRAAGVPRGSSHRGTIDVKNWSDSGDHGVAVTCRFTGPRKFSVAAYTHARKVARTPIAGFDGPSVFGGGRLYRSTDNTKCAAYWTPPNADYVISVQFTALQPVAVTACGAALRAVQPSVFAGLVRLHGGN